jgi:hypothetical protein
MSMTVGVGSNDEHSGSAVWGSGVGSSYNSPPCRHPQLGKVEKDIGKPHRPVSVHVLKHGDPPPPKDARAKGVNDVGPEMSFVMLALPLPCVAKRLAGVTACEYVNRRHGGPIDFGYVPKVRNSRVMCGKHLAGCWLNL